MVGNVVCNAWQEVSRVDKPSSAYLLPHHIATNQSHELSVSMHDNAACKSAYSNLAILSD